MLKYIRNITIKFIFVTIMAVGLILPATTDSNAAGNRIAKKALSRVGSRYVSGAAHSMGQIKNKRQRSFDCSGLVNWSYYQSGYKIGSRTTRSLSSVGHRVSKRKMKSGDIVLFRCSGSRISHAGIYVGAGKMVHAPGRGRLVQVVRLSGYWKTRLARVVRVAK